MNNGIFVFRLHAMSLGQLIELGNRMKILTRIARNEIAKNPDNVPERLLELINGTCFVCEQVLEELDARGV